MTADPSTGLVTGNLTAGLDAEVLVIGSGAGGATTAALLAEAGFDVVRATGVYLELLLNWLSPLPKLDRLQRAWNRPWAIPLMRLLLPMGAWAPRYALDLIFVARKRADAYR